MSGKADRVVELVHQMRRNAEDMRIWQNVPLAVEALGLLKAIPEDEETPLGKALACNAMLENLSEFDIPRFCMEILDYELSQLEISDEYTESLTTDDVRAQIQKLHDWISPGVIADAEYMRKHGRYLAWDPVERTPRWEELYLEVERECDERLGDTPRGMGFCFAYWGVKRRVLAEKGVEWMDPHQMNPRVMFD